jgi:hypothetical protein
MPTTALAIHRIHHLRRRTDPKQTVTEVNPDHDPGGEVARLVDGLLAALAQQPPAQPRGTNDSFAE